jgi:hypothetical protein
MISNADNMGHNITPQSGIEEECIDICVGVD